MLCPNCCHELKHISTKSHYGAIIKLNQCPACGGIWFDEWELFSLDDEEAKKLEEIDIKRLKAVCHISQKHKLCPTCQLPLEKFQDPNIPKEIDIESCRKCGGFWLARGETMEYKEYQEEKIKAVKLTSKKEPQDSDKFDENIKKLLESQSSDYETLGNIGRFLSTPIDRGTLRPIGETGEDVSSSERTANLAIRILMIIFRLFARY